MHQRFPSLRALRAFEAVVRHGSAAKAGEELHVSSGAVGHQIRALEEELGFRLFDRVGGEFSPTPAALELADEVRGGFDRIFAAVRRSRLSADPAFLTISCDVTFGILWLGPRIHRFAEEHPNIDVRLDLTDADPDASGRNVDAAIYFGYGDFTGYQAIRLTSESLSPVCSPQYLNTAGLSATDHSPAQLLKRPLIHVEWFEPDTNFRTLAWERWFAEAGVALPGTPLHGTHFSHTVSALQLASSGKGFALASDSLAADAIASGALVRPFEARLRLPRDYYLMYGEALADAGKVAAFRDWVLRESASFRTP